MGTPSFRLIIDTPRSSTLNMAIDEMLMQSQKKKPECPILRFYFWENPCYTTGYFQELANVRKKLGKSAEHLQLVRRLTGGGMVRHDKDLTFSLVLPDPNPFFPMDVKSSYLKINEAIREGLRQQLPDVEYADCKTVPSGRGGKNNDRICFEAPSCYDLLLGRRKIVGASQRRKDGSILHQSTIFLPEIESAALILLIQKGFKAKWGAEFFEEKLKPEELLRACDLEFQRYTSPEWANPAIQHTPS